MDRKVINKVLVVTTTSKIELECTCGGILNKIPGKVDNKTKRLMYRCNRCRDEVYLDPNITSVQMESMSNRHIIGTESVYIEKPYVCDCGGVIMYFGDRPGRCIKCNKEYNY